MRGWVLAKQRRKPCSGFTLVELIAVIVILAILASVGAGFVVNTFKAYSATQNRAALINSARPALERMSRQLRGALPYSLRLAASGRCLEFVPIAAGGNYLNPVPDSANGAPASGLISTAPFSIDFGQALYLSIGALSSAEIYGVSPGSRASVAATSATQVQLSAAKIWARNSVNRRFYLLNKPQAFCLVGSDLRVYESQDINATDVDLTASFALMAQGVSAVTPFSISGASENRNSLVTINLSFAKGAESLAFSQQVMVHNVP